MNDSGAITFAGRCFSSDEVALMRQATCDYAKLGITVAERFRKNRKITNTTRQMVKISVN